MDRRTWLLGLTGVAAAAVARAQNEPETPAPDAPAPKTPAEPAARAGMIPQGLRSYIVVDNRFQGGNDPLGNRNRNRKGKVHCPVCEFGLNPAVLVLARKVPTDAGEPLLALINRLDALGKTYRANRFGVATIFLTLEKALEDEDYRDKKVAEAARPFSEARSLEYSLIGITEATVSAEGQPQVAPAVKAFGVGTEDQVTVFLYDRFKVKQKWVFTDTKPLAAGDIDAIAGAIDKQLKPAPRKRPNLRVPD